MVDLTAIVVTYDRAHDDARALVDRLQSDSQFPIVVVANSDGFPDIEGVTVLRPARNLGFGPGVNYGAEHVATKWMALANPDTTLSSRDLLALMDTAEGDDHVAVLGPRLVYPDARPQINGGGYSGVAVEFSRALNLGPLLRPLRGLLRREAWARTGVASRGAAMLRRPWVSGAALVIRTEAWRAVGGFDTRYFMYFEDEDLCRRLRALGWEVGLDPSVTVAHRVGTTSHSNPYRSVVYQRSRVLYHSRYSPRWLQAFVRWSANRITDGQRRREMSARH